MLTPPVNDPAHRYSVQVARARGGWRLVSTFASRDAAAMERDYQVNALGLPAYLLERA